MVKEDLEGLISVKGEKNLISLGVIEMQLVDVTEESAQTL